MAEPPFINVEERIDRVVGRRGRTPDALSSASSRKADSVAWQRALGGTGVPRGIHRFRTHEEADAWLWRMDAALESREPTVEDLRDLCRALNERGARYVVIGGFAIRAAGPHSARALPSRFGRRRESKAAEPLTGRRCLLWRAPRAAGPLHG